MVKIPLLDLGNVVVRVDFSPFLSWLKQRTGRSEESLAGLLSSSLFYDLEFGHIGRAEFARRLGNLYGASFEATELSAKFCAIFPGLVDGIEPLLEELLAKGPVYCLSNTNEIHLEHLRAHYPILDRFTRVFASHQLHRRKPYPGVYVEVAGELGLRPENFVFFDDAPANVEGALRAGMDAHVFRSVEEMRSVLKDLPSMDDTVT